MNNDKAGPVKVEMPKLLKLNGLTPGATMAEEHIKGLFQKISVQKEKLIKAKLHEMGLTHLMDGFKDQRFRRIGCEMSKEGEETYWADNGTNDGLKIITFKRFQPKIDPETNMISGELEFYY